MLVFSMRAFVRSGEVLLEEFLCLGDGIESAGCTIEWFGCAWQHVVVVAQDSVLD